MTSQQKTPARKVTTSSKPDFTKFVTRYVGDFASMHPIESETMAPRDYVSPKNDETSTAILVTFNEQSSSNTTMTIVIAVAVGVVTLLVLTVVLLSILFRRRKQKQSHIIAQAKAKCAVQPTAHNVVHCKDIGGEVARVSIDSAARSFSSVAQSDASVACSASGAEQYTRTGASADIQQDVYALPVKSGEKADVRTEPCTSDNQLPAVRSVSTKAASTEQVKKPLPYHLTKKNPKSIASAPTVPSSDIMHGGRNNEDHMLCEVCPIENQQVAVHYSPYSLPGGVKSEMNRFRSATAGSAEHCDSDNGTDQVMEYALHGENNPVPSGITESCTQPTYTHLVFETRPLDQPPIMTHGSDIHPPVHGSVTYSAVDKTLTGRTCKELKE